MKSIKFLVLIPLLFCCTSLFAASQAKSDADLKEKRLEERVALLEKELRELQTKDKVLTPAPLSDDHVTTSLSSQKQEDAQSQKEKTHPSDYFSHRPVITTPVLDLHASAYDASDLLVQTSSMNEDLYLLQKQKTLENELHDYGQSLLDRPIVTLSGKVESQLIAGSDFGTGTSDINLSAAELDIYALVSPWASGYMSLTYDDSTPQTGNRQQNSRLFLSRGFLTIGNLNHFPAYLTMGQMYLPFGKYDTGMVSTPLTQSIFRILSRAGVIGLVKGDFFAQGYVFRGDSYTGSNPNTLNGFGANVGLSNDLYEFGLGYVSNIGDSQGMQFNGINNANFFNGFSVTTNTAFSRNLNQLYHFVPGGDIYGSLNLGSFHLISEYMTALRSFDSRDLSYDGQGATVSALHLEISYQTEFWSKIFRVGTAYGQSWEAYALNLPKNSYSIFARTSLIKDTIEAIEFRHDVNYPQSAADNSRGASVPANTWQGKYRNIVILQVGVYF